MAISHETELIEGLKAALDEAKRKKHKILFSEVVEVDNISPLSFYQVGREQYIGERFFWQDPNKDIIIAGLGKVEKIQVSAADSRFMEVEASWTALIENAVKTGILEKEGTGPLLFGGFSFDHNKSNSLLWDQFGDNLFYIPAFMLSIVKGQAYLTTNLICSPEDHVQLFIKMINERDTLLSGSVNFGNGHHEIIEQREIAPEHWKYTVANTIEEIKGTDLKKLVLAREMRLIFNHSVLSEQVLQKLAVEQQTSFVFSLETGSDCFIGASPERLIKKTGNEMFSTCLAGSIARGKTKQEDDRLGYELLHDQKNLVEHQYVVSMIGEAMKSVCSSVNIPKAPALMKNRHIQHLYTPVKGMCNRFVSIFEMIEKLHPTPALGGLPKEKAVRRIREVEQLERGFYSGPIGWTDSYGNGEFAVAIRSALLQGKEASLFAGCGIVEDSTPEGEYNETSIKFKPMLSALGGNLHE
ncbi:isochorismate synthase [Peribacillus cavernae]|uniref:isochorismate synthase n=1 Tax=Peribacillus cavernae TaxID=1674310 RepID=UPI001FE52E0C|nr:isochorismate synthase [Peribacillus cavernae]MDQ0220255.1 menaquinone-specific isochorismate synthase [Peribacillus cavernae]